MLNHATTYRALILLHTFSVFRIDLKRNIFIIFFWVFTLNHQIRRNMFDFYLTSPPFLRYFYAPFRQICVISSWESKFRWQFSICSDAYDSYKCFYKIFTQQNGLNCPGHIKNQSGVHLSWRVHLCWIYPINNHWLFTVFYLERKRNSQVLDKVWYISHKMCLIICTIDFYTKTGVTTNNFSWTKYGKTQWWLSYGIYCFDIGVKDNGDHVFLLSWRIVVNSKV